MIANKNAFHLFELLRERFLNALEISGKKTGNLAFQTYSHAVSHNNRSILNSACSILSRVSSSFHIDKTCV